MKEFTAEMLQTLQNANDSVCGTVDYTKYHMECYIKDIQRTNKRWKFYCWTIPHATGTIKTFNGETYIVCEFNGLFGQYMERYHVTDEVKELLNI